MLSLYTSRVGVYKKPDSLDITVKSGDIRFAPKWIDVLQLKSGRITWEQYTEIYKERMRESYK